MFLERLWRLVSWYSDFLLVSADSILDVQGFATEWTSSEHPGRHMPWYSDRFLIFVDLISDLQAWGRTSKMKMATE